jgi:hypothetical protein
MLARERAQLEQPRLVGLERGGIEGERFGGGVDPSCASRLR